MQVRQRDEVPAEGVPETLTDSREEVQAKARMVVQATAEAEVRVRDLVPDQAQEEAALLFKACRINTAPKHHPLPQKAGGKSTVQAKALQEQILADQQEVLDNISQIQNKPAQPICFYLPILDKIYNRLVHDHVFCSQWF